MKIDTSNLMIVYDACKPCVDRKTGEPILTPDGDKKWDLFTFVREQGDERSKQMKFKVVSAKDPAAGLTPFQPITVKNCELNVYSINGETVNSYSVESIAKA